MLPLSVLVHPRRLWLWSQHRPDIESQARLLLPPSYSIEGVLREEVPNLDALIEARLSKEPLALKPEATSKRSRLSKEKLTDLGFAGADAFVLYGGFSVLESLGTAHSQIVASTLQVLSNAILNVANLAAARASAESLLGSSVASPLLPFVSPLINGCFQHAERHCQALFPQFGGGETTSSAATHALDVHRIGPHVGTALLDPHDAIAASPSDAVTAHLAEHGSDHFDNVAATALDHGGEAATAGAIDHVSSHLPWFTLVRSSYREIELLRADKTNLQTAILNVGTDTASMAIGAKVGATIGSVVPVVGTLIGAVAGGIAGRYFGNEFKQRDLKKAIQAYEDQVTMIAQAQRLQEERTANQFGTARQQEQTALEEQATRAINASKAAAASLSAWTNSLERLNESELRNLLIPALKELESQTAQLRSSEDVRWVRRLFWPSVQGEATKVALGAITKRQSDIRLILANASKDENLTSSVILSILAEYGLTHSQVRNYVHRIEAERQMRERQMHAVLEQNHAEVLAQRYGAVERLNVLLKELSDEATRALEPLISKLDALGKDVLREKGKLGLA